MLLQYQSYSLFFIKILMLLLPALYARFLIASVKTKYSTSAELRFKESAVFSRSISTRCRIRLFIADFHFIQVSVSQAYCIALKAFCLDVISHTLIACKNILIIQIGKLLQVDI